MNAENASLKSDLDIVRNEVAVLKHEHAELKIQADSLRSSLLRYQMNPIIRFARGVYRRFN